MIRELATSLQSLAGLEGHFGIAAGPRNSPRGVGKVCLDEPLELAGKQPTHEPVMEGLFGERFDSMSDP